MGITKKVRDKIRAMKHAGYTTREIADYFQIPEAIVVNVIETGLLPKKSKK